MASEPQTHNSSVLQGPTARCVQTATRTGEAAGQHTQSFQLTFIPKSSVSNQSLWRIIHLTSDDSLCRPVYFISSPSRWQWHKIIQALWHFALFRKKDNIWILRFHPHHCKKWREAWTRWFAMTDKWFVSICWHKKKQIFSETEEIT